MGMNRDITMVRGIKVGHSALNGRDIDDFEFPYGVYWYPNDTDYVIGSHFVELSEIQDSIEVDDDLFSTEYDEEAFSFCLNVLGLFCDRSDIKIWAVAESS